VIERSAHPVAWSGVVALAVALTQPQTWQIERRVGLFLIFAAWLGGLMTYGVAREAGLGPGYASASVALLAIASPWLAYTRSYFSEQLTGVVLIGALWALQRGRPVACALLSALATAFKPMNLLVAAGWILERWFAGRRRDALKIATVTAVATTGLLAFNYWQARVLLIAGNDVWRPLFWDRWSFPFHTLLDPTHGLFPFVPWAVVLLAAFQGSAVPEHSPSGELLRQALWPIACTLPLLLVTAWVGANCYGCRYWVPFLPSMAIATLVLVRRFPVLRVPTVALAILGALIAIPGALQYRSGAWDVQPFAPLAAMISGTPPGSIGKSRAPPEDGPPGDANPLPDDKPAR
jgi:hypothetical protein